MAGKSPLTAQEGSAMPIATPEVHNRMLDAARAAEYAPRDSTSLLRSPCTPRSEASPSGQRRHRAGVHRRCRVPIRHHDQGHGTGSVALAEFANVVAAKYPTNVALLTDHCQKSWNGSASYGPTPRSSRVCAEGVLNASHHFVCSPGTVHPGNARPARTTARPAGAAPSPPRRAGRATARRWRRTRAHSCRYPEPL